MWICPSENNTRIVRIRWKCSGDEAAVGHHQRAQLLRGPLRELRPSRHSRAGDFAFLIGFVLRCCANLGNAACREFFGNVDGRDDRQSMGAPFWPAVGVFFWRRMPIKESASPTSKRSTIRVNGA